MGTKSDSYHFGGKIGAQLRNVGQRVGAECKPIRVERRGKGSHKVDALKGEGISMRVQISIFQL